MGRKTKHNYHKYDQSSDSFSSNSSRSQSSYSSSSNSSSESVPSIKYHKDKSSKRKNYQGRSKKQTRDIEDDYNFPKKIPTILEMKKNGTPQKGNGRVNSKSMRVIPLNDTEDGFHVPANTRRTKIYDKTNTYAEQQIVEQAVRSRTKSQIQDSFNKQTPYQIQKQQQEEDLQDSLNADQMNLRKVPLRRQSQKALLISNNSLASNNGSLRNSMQVLSPQTKLNSPQILNNNSNQYFSANQQHHISNFARIQPINNSMSNSMNGVLNNSHNITIQANQQENQVKESDDVLKLEIKNKELNRIQTQQRQALNNVTQILQRKKSVDNIEFVNREKDKELKEKHKNVLAYNNCIIYTKKFWSRLIKYIQYQHFLSHFVYRIVNVYGLKSTFHFKFLTTCINFYIFGTLVFLYPIIKQLIIYNDRFSSEGIQLFYLSYLENSQGGIVYFNILLLLIAAVLICMAYYRYMHYQKNAIVFEVQKAKGLKYFTMIFCEYNWKLPHQKPRLLFQLSLTKKVFSSFEEEDQVYRQLKYVNQLTQLFKDFLFYILYLGVILCSGYFLLALNNNEIIDKRISSLSQFLNECIISGIVIAFIEICSFIITLLIQLLQHFETNSLQQQSTYMKDFIYQAIAYSLYIFIRSSFINKNQQIIQNLVDTDYSKDGYDCPQQSIAQSLLSLYLVHYVFILYIKQLLKRIVNHFREVDNYIKGDLKCLKENKHRRQFKIIENTIPVVISNMIILMNSPFNFAIYPIGLVFTFIFLIHNSLLIQYTKLPEYLTISSIATHGIIVVMFLFSLFLNFIHFFFISTLDQPLFYYVSDPTRVCGPFSKDSTSLLSYTFQYLLNQNGFQNFLDIIFWRPLLICIIVFFILKSIANKKQYSKWLTILRYRSKEINAVKKHYKKKVLRLSKQLDGAAKDIRAIQKDSQLPQANKTNAMALSIDKHVAQDEYLKSLDKIQTEESHIFQQTQLNLRNRKRSSFINETSEIQNVITKPDYSEI